MAETNTTPVSTVAKTLPADGYLDTLLWGKQERESDGEPVKKVVFPITRYRNALNRPRMITVEENIELTPPGDFHLVAVDIEDMDDDQVYKLYKQTW